MTLIRSTIPKIGIEVVVMSASPLTTKAAEIRAGLVERLREHVRSRGGLSRDAESGEIVLPNGAWAMMLEAAALIEQQAAELAGARAGLAAQIAGHRHSAKEATTLLIERKDRAKERDRIVAAGEELAAALSRYGFPMSDEAWRNTGDDAPASSQASVEARALHRAAEAFFREISGAHHE